MKKKPTNQTNKQIFEMDQVSDYVRFTLEYILHVLHVCINESFDMSNETFAFQHLNVEMSH